jgi:hypothetical protein
MSPFPPGEAAERPFLVETASEGAAAVVVVVAAVAGEVVGARSERRY